MDLSWNFAAESQAYDRVHRLGQEKDVFVKRFVVEDTLEERMLRLQDVKMGACILIYPPPFFSHSI
jgi:SNF2 family DNA or RNA helicase